MNTIELIEANEKVTKYLMLIDIFNKTYTSSNNEKEFQSNIDLCNNLFSGFKDAIGESVSMEGFVQTAMNIIDRTIEAIAELIKKLFRILTTLFSNRAKKLEKLNNNSSKIELIGHDINVDLSNHDHFQDFEVLKNNLISLHVFDQRAQKVTDIADRIHSLDKTKLKEPGLTTHKSKEHLSGLLNLSTVEDHKLGFSTDPSSLLHISHVSDTDARKSTNIHDIESATHIYLEWKKCGDISNKYYNALEKIKSLNKEFQNNVSSLSKDKHNIPVDNTEEIDKISGALHCTQTLVTFTLYLIHAIENDLIVMEKISNIIMRFIGKYRKGVIE